MKFFIIDKTYMNKNLNSPSLTSSKKHVSKNGYICNKFSHNFLMYELENCHNEINDNDN